MFRKLPHPFITELKRYVANQNATLGPIVMSLSELIQFRNQPDSEHEHIRQKQRKLSEVTDMIHAAHVFHRCVSDCHADSTDDSLTSAKAKRLHQDNVMSLLLGDYLLAQSSVDMADLRCPPTVGFIAKGLEDYTRGEFLKLRLLDQCKLDGCCDHHIICNGVEEYAELTCGSLLSNASQSTALLAGHNDSIQKLASAFGFHTGTAHRLTEILYCPNTNSSDDQVLIDKLDSKSLDESINEHLIKSKELLSEISASVQPDM